ncbi:unnamed protein product [Phytomonas sp. EM1]|nr:unnamed protein product [Phytomonas sp. EM1]|eukprot:CCW61546.1 unnamed protein product [Phytomonas sp. isolate EM1]
MIEPVVFSGDDNKLHNIAIDPDILGPLGLGFEMPVETSKGDGSIIGVEDNNVCVLLDSNRTKQLITTFPLHEMGGSVRLLHGTYPEHRLKTVLFREHRAKIVTQNRQGPCPVLALFNALVLSNRMHPSYYSEYSITSRELIKSLASYLSCNESTTLMCGAATAEGLSHSLSGLNEEVPEIRGTKDKDTHEIGSVWRNTNVETTTLPVAPASTLTELIRNPSALQLVRESLLRTQEQVVSLLNRLYNGMNINPIFTDCEGFVADNDVSLFALAGLRLLHGWVIIPESVYAPLRKMSFNELTTLVACSPPLDPLVNSNPVSSPFYLIGTSTPSISKHKDIAQPISPNHTSTTPTLHSQDKGDAEEAASMEERDSDSTLVSSKEFYNLAKSFYEATNSAQMTPEGYAELVKVVKEGEVVVIFWRNHFFSCVKLQDRLLALCSDESFADKPSIVFSVISQDMEEDGFTDADGVDVDSTIRYVQAVAGDRFSETVIRAAKHKLAQLHPMQRNDPKAVADYLLEDRERAEKLQEESNHINNQQRLLSTDPPGKAQLPRPRTDSTPPNGSQPQLHLPATASGNATVSSTHTSSVYTSMTSIVSRFRDIFPQVTEEMAMEYLLKHGGNLESAINSYMCA